MMQLLSMKSYVSLFLVVGTLRPYSAFSVSNDPSAKTTTKTTKTPRSEPCLTHSSDSNGPITFDTACVANPVVLPPSKHYDKWQMYYYGNDGSWNLDYPNFLPTGSSGLAESEDGIVWTKVVGPCRGGAVLTPSDNPDDWDCVQTGVSDVIRMNDGSGEWHMYYFGADREEIAFGPSSQQQQHIAGFRMRIGRAKSKDHGRTWIKDPGYLLDYDPTEGVFASWPRILRSDDEQCWKMVYHAFDGTTWRVFGATSSDRGDSWVRTGLVLEGDMEDSDAFDHIGIGTRAVVPWRDGWLMVYEGVDMARTHKLGAAYCAEESCLESPAQWKKLNGGRPMLEPAMGPLGDWCKHVIGTPFLVALPNSKALRLYHCGITDPKAKMSIGMVESESGDITPQSWSPVERQ